MMFCNYQLLNMYFPQTLAEAHITDNISNRDELAALFNDLSARRPATTGYPYGFAEKILADEHSLFKAFESELKEKTVLVISPFSRSIEKNFPNRGNFFANYRYPDFALRTLNTPITYSGLPSELYPHADWFETLDHLKKALNDIDFDIALLSCGSYAMPLGLHIQDALSKQAIYVGGILQLYFGVMGRRYDGPFVTRQINKHAFIWPVERDDYLKHISIKGNAPTEGFGAYF